MIGFGNAANIVSSNVFLTTEAPKYPTGFTTGLIFTALGFFLVCTGTLLLFQLNRTRDRKRIAMSNDEKEIDDNRHFRFHL